MFGFYTFIATTSPVLSTALWT